MVTAKARKTMIPKQLPSNAEAEEMVLGTILLCPDVAAEATAALSPADFLQVANCTIFQAVGSLVEAGILPDVIAVADKLTALGKIEEAGGRLRLNHLQSLPTTDVSLSHYVNIVKQDSQRRSMYFAAGQIEALALDESKSVGEIQDEAQRLLERTGRLVSTGSPVIETRDTTVRVDWVHQQVRAVVTGLREKDSDVTGFLKISTTIPGHPRDLHSARFNFVSTRSQSEWANILTKRADITDWHEIMTTLCQIVTDHVHKGDPFEEVGLQDEPEPVEYVLHPLLLYRSPTVLFGEPGTLKSYIATLAAYLVGLGQGHIDLQARRMMKRPLYLDWEGEKARLDERIVLLRNGIGLPKLRLSYRHCSRPLADDVDRIREQIADEGNEFIVIDSLGLACGGDLNSPQPAIDFFAALRSLNCSSLIVAHNSKLPTGPRSIFGSVFFTALARSIWETRRDQEEGSEEVPIGIIHKKANYGMLEHPIGFRFLFETGRTRVEDYDAKDVASAAAARPLAYRIRRVLEDGGKMTCAQIAEELSADSSTIRTTLNRMRDKREVCRLDGSKWGLEIRGSEHEHAPF